MTILKRSLLAVSFALVSTLALADSPDETASQAYPYACTAVTTCFSPFQPPYSLACQTFGKACTWWTVPGISVQCTGFDVYGRWVNVYFRCL